MKKLQIQHLPAGAVLLFDGHLYVRPTKDVIMKKSVGNYYQAHLIRLSDGEPFIGEWIATNTAYTLVDLEELQGSIK